MRLGESAGHLVPKELLGRVLVAKADAVLVAAMEAAETAVNKPPFRCFA